MECASKDLLPGMCFFESRTLELYSCLEFRAKHPVEDGALQSGREFRCQALARAILSHETPLQEGNLEFQMSQKSAWHLVGFFGTKLKRTRWGSLGCRGGVQTRMKTATPYWLALPWIAHGLAVEHLLR